MSVDKREVDWAQIIFFILLAILVAGIIHIGTDLCNLRQLLEARILEVTR